MRRYYEIDLAARSAAVQEWRGEQLVRAGRYLIARTLLDAGAAAVDPLSPANPLIFSAGPLAGSSFSNANRTSVGCKSPLTGGIKEANGGGSFSYGLGQLEIAGLTLHGVAEEWTILHFGKNSATGEVRLDFDDAAPFMGRGNFETAQMLFDRYGKKIVFALCGPVGEYQGLLAGIAFTDIDGRPSRLAARGGVGAVMGSKRVKAIVVDTDRMPTFHDRPKVLSSVRDYARLLRADSLVVDFYQNVGTMGMADLQNQLGGIPVNNFTAGSQADTAAGEIFKLGGDYIGELNAGRGGIQTHACMPGCIIQCSNVYYGPNGTELVSPVEYETLGLLGTNCGISDPDHLAGLNYIANDLGVDTIETGATLAVLMEAGLAEFGDVNWMIAALAEIRAGTERGRLWAQGTARVGEEYGVRRVPVIKRQAISAYDPRVIEGTAVTMMVTAQGADHTAGNLPRLKTREMSLGEIMEKSLQQQARIAAQDSLGFCIFGGSVTVPNQQFIMDAINAAAGTQLGVEFFEALGRETLRMEREFNRLAGFGEADDELPAFFYDEPLPPTNRTSRFHAAEVQPIWDGLAESAAADAEIVGAGDVPAHHVPAHHDVRVQNDATVRDERT